MIGNDIVDLTYTRLHSDWTRKGFLAKVFTKSEQSYIAQANDPFTCVWRLWSMKESAYKIHLRTKQVRSFYPTKISCKLIDDKHGMVFLEGETYHTTTSQLKEYIFSFATSTNSKKANHDIVTYDSKLPENYYELINEKLALTLNCKPYQINVIKNEVGIPQVYVNDIKQQVYISTTHHGKFLALSTTSIKNPIPKF